MLPTVVSRLGKDVPSVTGNHESSRKTPQGRLFLNHPVVICQILSDRLIVGSFGWIRITLEDTLEQYVPRIPKVREHGTFSEVWGCPGSWTTSTM